MKTLTNKNKMKFNSYEELKQYFRDNNLVCLAQVGNASYHRYSYISSHTHVNRAYAYDFYVANTFNNTLIKHTKLKVYYQNNGGYYVLSQGQKCWVNSFWNRKTDMFVTGEEVIKNLKERGV